MEIVKPFSLWTRGHASSLPVCGPVLVDCASRPGGIAKVNERRRMSNDVIELGFLIIISF
jgi:hypothetical protein